MSSGTYNVISCRPIGATTHGSGPITVMRPDKSGELVVVATLPAPGEAEFVDKVGEWARKQIGPRASKGGKTSRGGGRPSLYDEDESC